MFKAEHKIKSNLKEYKSVDLVCGSFGNEIKQVLKSFPIANNENEEAASLFFLNTESSWLGLLALAIRRVDNKASFLEELTIYNHDKHVGRLDLLISVPNKHDESRYYLVEAKCREWKGLDYWSISNANGNFNNIYEQASKYAKEIIRKSFSHFEPEIISLSFDWIRKGISGSSQRIDGANKYFYDFEIEKTDIDFLSFYHTEVDGLFVYGKIGKPNSQMTNT